MTAIEILQAFSEDGELLESVLGWLNWGMHDEWDCGLQEREMWGPEELRIAARSGLLSAKYVEGLHDES